VTTNLSRLYPLLLPALLAAGCNKNAPQAAPPPKPPEVQVAYPVPMRVTDYEDFTGRTELYEVVEVRSRTTGYLSDIHFKDGISVTVKQGDKLFTIDQRPYKAELDRAKANLAAAEARFKRLEGDLDRAVKARTATAPEELAKIRGDRDEAAAAVKVAEANLAVAKLNLEFTEVTAPISGQISRRLVDRGNLVKADETILAIIGSFDKMYVTFDLDEKTVLRLRQLVEQGLIRSPRDYPMPFRFALANDDGYPHEGVLESGDIRIDIGTGTLRLRGVFLNTKNLLPGLFVRVRLPIGEERPALLINDRAVGTDQGRKFIYVLDKDNKAISREVELGKVHAGLREVRYVQIVESVSEPKPLLHNGKPLRATRIDEKKWRFLVPLDPQDRLVISGLQRFRPGAVVTPKLVAMPGAPAAKTASQER